MLGFTSNIANDSLNFIYSDKINPDSPAFKELQGLMEDHKYYTNRLKKMEGSFKAGDIYKDEEQFLKAKNKVQESINVIVNRMQQITGDAKSTTVKGYRYDADPKATDLKPKTDLGDANIVLADSRWGQLSNLADHTFTYDGREYRSVEHAYQTNKSGKFHEPTYRAYFDKPEARKINTGPVANQKTNIQLMEDLYRQMLSENLDVSNLLKETEGFDITHQLKKNDIWTTEMPKILTKLRDELINPSQTGEIEKLKGGTQFNQVSPKANYPIRTEFNAENSDITIDFTRDESKGSGATKRSVNNAGKTYQPVIVNEVGLMKNQDNIDELAKVIADNLTNGKTVNIAGHGAYKSTRPGSVGFNEAIQQSVFDNELNKVFDRVKFFIGDKPITGMVISGGQSGYDEAGIKAAKKIGVNTQVNFTGEGLYRPPEALGAKDDINNAEQFRNRFNRFGPGGMPPIDTPEFATWYEKEIETKNSKEIVDDIAKNADVEPSLVRKSMGEVPGFLVVPLEAAIEVSLRYGRIAKTNPNLAKNARRFIMYELAMFAASVVTGVVSYGDAKFTATTGFDSRDLYSPYNYKDTDESNQKMEEAIAYNAEIQQLYEEYPELKEYNEAMAHQFAMQEASENMDFFIKKMPTYYIDEVLFEYVPVLKEAREEYADKKFFSEGGWRAALAQPQLLEKGVEWTIDAILGNKRVEKEAWSYGR